MREHQKIKVVDFFFSWRVREWGKNYFNELNKSLNIFFFWRLFVFPLRKRAPPKRRGKKSSINPFLKLFLPTTKKFTLRSDQKQNWDYQDIFIRKILLHTTERAIYTKKNWEQQSTRENTENVRESFAWASQSCSRWCRMERRWNPFRSFGRFPWTLHRLSSAQMLSVWKSLGGETVEFTSCTLENDWVWERTSREKWESGKLSHKKRARKKQGKRLDCFFFYSLHSTSTVRFFFISLKQLSTLK